jgi:hypothetical protein
MIIGSDAFASYDSSRANLSIDGRISGLSETAFGDYSYDYDFNFGTLLIRGSKISGALCAAIQKSSPKAVLVTSGSGFTLNQSLCCNGTLQVTGFSDPTPFPTAPASLSPRATVSLASNSPVPPNPNNAANIWMIVGVVLGEIALVVISVGITSYMMRRRRRKDGETRLFSGVGGTYT